MRSSHSMFSPITDSRFDFRPELIVAPKWAKMLLFAFAGGVHLLANLLYVSSNGPLSSPTGDIWFFVGVALGSQHLFPTDPLQLLLPIFGFLGPSAVFVLLVLLSNTLHLLTLWLLLGALTEFFNDEWSSIWGCAFFTLTINSGFTFCTGAFFHQQESLPVLVVLLWSGHLYMMAPTSRERLRHAGVIVALLILGAIIGPDALALTTMAAPCAMIWHFRRFMDPFIRHAMGTALLVLYFTTIALAAPYLVEVVAYGAQIFRGINLQAQLDLRAGELAGLDWLQVLWVYGPVYLLFAVFAIWTWTSGRLPELALIFTGVIFSTVAERFFYIAELGLAALVCWALARPLRYQAVSKHTVGGVVLVAMLGYASWKAVPCGYPGSIVGVIEELGRDPRPNKLVLCTPTYGFMVQAVGGARPTSSLHAIDPSWVRIAMMPAEEAVTILGAKGVTHVFLTSMDFNLGTRLDSHGTLEPGFVGSGGFGMLLNDMPHDKVSASLVHRALLGKAALPGLTPLKEAVHLPTEQRAVLFRVEPTAPAVPAPGA